MLWQRLVLLWQVRETETAPLAKALLLPDAQRSLPMITVPLANACHISHDAAAMACRDSITDAPGSTIISGCIDWVAQTLCTHSSMNEYRLTPRVVCSGAPTSLEGVLCTMG
jgi:hypothetical protein